jgi:hypothetical protein
MALWLYPAGIERAAMKSISGPIQFTPFGTATISWLAVCYLTEILGEKLHYSSNYIDLFDVF